MHVQNILTGSWLHRDVQGITTPSIIWQLNNPDTFSCTLTPPRPDLLDATGNPAMNEWQHAIYLEENDDIKFGGILTASTVQGPAWNITAAGFAGYPSGMPYEGPVVTQSGIDGLDAVRNLWAWLQSQPGSDLELVLGPGKSGVQLGIQAPPGATSTLTKAISPGNLTLTVRNATAFSNNQIIIAGSSLQHTIKSISGNVITVTSPFQTNQAIGSAVVQIVVPTPYSLAWWNSTDIGQEIASIQSECIFDWQERHTWTDAAKNGVFHQLLFGVPRVGTRRLDLRFAEGENIVVGSQVSRDGSSYANAVVGLGAGQGSLQIRETVTDASTGRLRRVTVYTDQTIKTQARMTVAARKVLTSKEALDTPTQVVVKNHQHAPFGSFGCGDDILVTLATGWRKAQIWCRILQIQQDPTTNLMTLTLARSDSFTYMAQSGQAGTI
jgi:hypothetical protein